MPVPVPSRFDGVALAGCRVAAPASYGQAAGWASNLAFLFGRVTHQVFARSALPLANGTFRVPVLRSEAARALLVVVSLNDGLAEDAKAYVTVTLGPPGSFGSAARVETAVVLDGATALPCPQARQRVQQEYFTLFTLSGSGGTYGTETLYDVTFTTSSAAGTARGLYGAAIYEIPRGALNPESNP
jgi:hypothetical protein